jgi:hypothetical protein
MTFFENVGEDFIEVETLGAGGEVLDSQVWSGFEEYARNYTTEGYALRFMYAKTSLSNTRGFLLSYKGIKGRGHCVDGIFNLEIGWEIGL